MFCFFTLDNIDYFIYTCDIYHQHTSVKLDKKSLGYVLFVCVFPFCFCGFYLFIFSFVHGCI